MHASNRVSALRIFRGFAGDLKVCRRRSGDAGGPTAVEQDVLSDQHDAKVSARGARFTRRAEPTGGSDESFRVGLHVGQLLQPVPGGIGRVTELLARGLRHHVQLVPFAPGHSSSNDRASRRGWVARSMFEGAVFLRIEFSTSSGIELGRHGSCSTWTSVTLPASRCPRRARLWSSPSTTWHSFVIRRRSRNTGCRFHERALDVARKRASADHRAVGARSTGVARRGFRHERDPYRCARRVDAGSRKSRRTPERCSAPSV